MNPIQKKYKEIKQIQKARRIKGEIGDFYEKY